VTDRGPGVPVGYQSDIFRPFVHAAGENGRTPDSRALQGAGLGLSVVKAVVEAHGGQVGVEDRTGGGSGFWLTLPVTEKVAS
jgi:signal transduction histidine kinase